MKKVKYLFLLLLSILLIPNGVFAASYDIDGTMSVEIDNSEWYVFTRNNIENNKELEELGVTYEYMDNFFKSNNAYLDAMLVYQNTGEIIELIVRKTNSAGAINSSNYSDDDFLESVKKELSNRNISNTKIYNKNGYKYAYVEYSDSGYSISQYFTVINGYNYAIHIQKVGNIDDEDSLRFSEIIDSIKFKVDTSLKEPKIKSEKGFFDSIVGRAIIGALIGAAIGGGSSVIMMVVKKNKNNNN